MSTIILLYVVALPCLIYLVARRLADYDPAFQLFEEPPEVEALRVAVSMKADVPVGEMRVVAGRWQALTTVGWVDTDDLLAGRVGKAGSPWLDGINIDR